MTQEECLAELKKCHTGDAERAHAVADKVLIDFIRSLGFDKIADEFLSIQKWYS